MKRRDLSAPSSEGVFLGALWGFFRNIQEHSFHDEYNDPIDGSINLPKSHPEIPVFPKAGDAV